jgi:hypothetical protein
MAGGEGKGRGVGEMKTVGRYREKRRMISFSSSPCLSDSAHRVTTITTTAAAAGGVSLLASELAVVVIVVANRPATHLSNCAHIHTYPLLLLRTTNTTTTTT